MKIAIISDIHGNSFALKAVMKEIYRKKIDKIYFLGDFVGYYYHPREVYKILIENNVSMILGNHEHILFDIIKGQIQLSEINKLYGSGHKIALEQFTLKEIAELNLLPNNLEEKIEGISLSFNHGSPFDNNCYIYPDAPIELLNRCDTMASYTFIGHTHYPFVTKLASTILINVGSVGQSRKIGGQASWCILNLKNNILEMQSTPYDVEPLLLLAKKYDSENKYLSEILKRNNKYE